MTTEQAGAILTWCQSALGIEDWACELHLMDDPPEWCGSLDSGDAGMCSSDRDYKTSKIWVSPSRCERYGFDLTATLCHECLHMALDDAGLDKHGEPPIHALVHKLESVLATAYGAEHGRKRR